MGSGLDARLKERGWSEVTGILWQEPAVLLMRARHFLWPTRTDDLPEPAPCWPGPWGPVFAWPRWMCRRFCAMGEDSLCPPEAR